jgi:arylsulfatase A-like enzyme
VNVVLLVFDSLRRDCTGVYGAPPWGGVHAPNLERLAAESVRVTRAFPNVLPTLPARVALHSGRQVYPFPRGDIRLKGDFVGAAGWGPIPEEWPTLAERLQEAGYRTALVSDTYHMFKPSKNFWRGFDQWTFLRGREADPARTGPRLSQAELDHWVPPEVRALRGLDESPSEEAWMFDFVQRCVLNLHDRTSEADYFAPRVLAEAARWLEQNQDAERFFLTIDSFDPHEPWFVPEHYRRMYQAEDGPEQVFTFYADVPGMSDYLLARTRANYRGSVTQCDRWLGHLLETLRVLGRLDDTLLIVTADHGHTLGERGYMGKSGYPSRPEVLELPLLVRFPGGEHGGTTWDEFVQHVDLTASILAAAGLDAEGLDGISFLDACRSGARGPRDHVTIGWGSTPTVVDERFWLNCKVDGTGVLLHDLAANDPFAANVADEQRDEVDRLFELALEDAGGRFPEWLVALAAAETDAPGCSLLAARASAV